MQPRPACSRCADRCPGRAVHPIARRQERPTLSLLCLRCPDHPGRNGPHARLAAAGPGNRRRGDQGPDRRADQPRDAARALRNSRHTERSNPENARSCNPSRDGPQSLASATSQSCSRPYREGRDRRECNHDQDPPLCTIGRSSRATLIGEPQRQPNPAYSACGLQAPRCRNEAGAAGSGNTERPLEPAGDPAHFAAYFRTVTEVRTPQLTSGLTVP